MKTIFTLTTSMFSMSAMAHAGPEALDAHLIEHIILALIVGVPTIYGLLRLMAASFKKGC